MRYENDAQGAHPLETVLRPGTYYWCRCGKTHKAPYCDGAHAGTGVTPQAFRIESERPVSLCDCGLTARPPYCDGHSHDDL